MDFAIRILLLFSKVQTALKKNSHYFDFDLTDIYDVEKYKILSPKDDGEWPQGKIPASDLAISTHFDWVSPVTLTDKKLEEDLCHKESNISGRADYAVYHVKESGKVRVLILEAKRGCKLNDNSVCQTVGYYIASASQNLNPPLGILMTNSKIRFIFFPFGDHSISLRYVDAFVSDEIMLFKNEKHFHYIVAFIVKYILETQWDCRLIKTCTSIRSLHKKEMYSVTPHSENMEAKEQELEAKEQELEAKEQKLEAKEQELEAKEQKLEQAKIDIQRLTNQLSEAKEENETGMCPASQFCSIIK